MKSYLELMQKILTEGHPRDDRTGTGTRSLFGEQMRFDLSKTFPILTTKKIHFKSVVVELLWFLKGKTNLDYLHRHNCTIWDEWADEQGELGPVYGKQWRNWSNPDGTQIDQIEKVIEQIKTNPSSRRLIVSAWNPSDLPDDFLSPQENVKNGKMALATCHTLFQFYVSKGKLSCQLYARSQDFFLGSPFNISSYALLTILVAQETGLQPGEFIWTSGDTHLYQNHLKQAQIQLQRIPYPQPKLNIRRKTSLFEYEPDDFELIDYKFHPKISAPIAV